MCDAKQIPQREEEINHTAIRKWVVNKQNNLPVVAAHQFGQAKQQNDLFDLLFRGWEYGIWNQCQKWRTMVPLVSIWVNFLFLRFGGFYFVW